MNLTRTFRHDEAVVGVAILAVVGVLLTIGVQKMVNRFLPWYSNM
jgi:ABC-type nitrate/sulfonate/bicarbonate transport system permease component